MMAALLPLKHPLGPVDDGGPRTKKLAKGKESAGTAAKIRSFVGALRIYPFWLIRLTQADFCAELVEKLPVCVDEQSIAALLDKASQKVEAIDRFSPKHQHQQHQHPSAKLLQKHSADLDHGATRLWNTCRRLCVEDRLRVPTLPRSTVGRTTLLLTARVYAVLALLLARVVTGEGIDVVYCRQVLKVVPWLLRTTRMCLGRLDGWACLVAAGLLAYLTGARQTRERPSWPTLA